MLSEEEKMGLVVVLLERINDMRTQIEKLEEEVKAQTVKAASNYDTAYRLRQRVKEAQGTASKDLLEFVALPYESTIKYTNNKRDSLRSEAKAILAQRERNTA